MIKPQKSQNMNHYGRRNSTTIDDLDDHMLTQILFRLPFSPPIIAYKLVNKRWCCLISDPNFQFHFSNHKKEIITLSESVGPNVDDDDKPPWTFIAIMKVYATGSWHQYLVGNASNKEAVFTSPKFSLGFLPCAFRIEATFKDLILCSGLECNRIYYITNPVTKQWVALPPCPHIFDQFYGSPWVGLVCQQLYDYTQDYKFRVVVIDNCVPPVQLSVYCSEIGEWKTFDLTVSINPKLADEKRLIHRPFKGVVCKGIIYLYHMLYFAAFNPFDVDETTDTTTIEAKLLPSLPYSVGGYMLESSGELFFVHNPNPEHYVWYKKYGTAIELPLKVWTLDPNQVPLIWKTAFTGSFTGNVKETDELFNDNLHFVADFAMHPKNDKLIYTHLYYEQQLILCDTRTRLVKPLESMPPRQLMRLHSLELQWWPTLVPKVYTCRMPLNKE